MGRHLTSGLQLISLRGRKGHIQEVGQGYGLCDNEESQIIEECLIQFSLLDLQIIIYEPDWIPFSMARCPKLTKSPSFSSFAEARLHLTALLLRTMEQKRLEVGHDASNPLENGIISPKGKNILEDLDRWSAAFKSFLATTTRSLTKEQTRAAQQLQIQHLAGYIHLSVAASDEATSYDKFLPGFLRIVSLCSALLTPSDTPTNSKHPRPKKFLYEHGVIPSLYLVGYKCREPIVRRQAHSLLACIRRKEGVWESDLMAKVVEHIIAVEESNRVVRTSSDVPNEARVWREHIQAGGSSKLPKVLFEIKGKGNEGVRIVERELH